MKPTMHSVSWILLLVPFLFSCPGQSEKSGLKDPLGAIPNESVSPGLAGDWSLKETVTESDCKEIRRGENAPDQSILKIDRKGCSLKEDIDFGTEVTCEVGGERVGVVSTMGLSIKGCELHGEEKLVLNYNEKTKKLTGEGELTATISGTCPREVQEKVGNGCHLKLGVMGSRFNPNVYSVQRPLVSGKQASESEPVINPVVIEWIFRLCEGVVCGQGERCFFGDCIE